MATLKKLTITLSKATINSPIIITMIVDAPLAIEEQSILASFQRQRSILALEKFVAEIRVGVRGQAVGVRAGGQ